MKARASLRCCSACGIGAVIVLQRPFDIDGVRIVTFNDIAAIAVHRPHEIGQRSKYSGGQAAAEAGRAGGELNSQIGERRAMP